jgi:hypothetical protein
MEDPVQAGLPGAARDHEPDRELVSARVAGERRDLDFRDALQETSANFPMARNGEYPTFARSTIVWISRSTSGPQLYRKRRHDPVVRRETGV